MLRRRRRSAWLLQNDRESWGGPGGIAISPDGNVFLFLYSQIDNEGKDLMLVKNGSW
jgi:hypothetical protein